MEETLEKTPTISKEERLWAMHFLQVKSLIVQPKKTHEVKVKTKSGGTYSYKYADLKDTDKAVMDACKKVKDKDGNVAFGYYFDVDNGQEGVSVQTILLDSSGYYKATNKVWFKNFNIGKAQETASLISYAKRYSLSAAFGIASDDDSDVNDFQPAQQPRDVNSNGLKVIWEAYINHSEEAKKWILQPHDPETALEIKKLSQHYKLKQQQQEEENKKKAIAKIKQSDDEEIKKLVDGDDGDPHKDKATDEPLTDQQQDLFNDIVGE